MVSFKIQRRTARHLLAFICFAAYCSSTTAQFTISGRILSRNDKKVVSDVSVFLSNATIGTKTDNNGAFTLSNIKSGKYELVVSAIGFNTYHQIVTIDDKSLIIGDIEMSVKPIILKEVRIRGYSDSVWQRNYRWFKDGFLGTSGLARDCKIMNPDVLDFSYKAQADTFNASSYDFLIIENNALGYRLKYLINYFLRCDNGKMISYEGSVLFENMKGTPSQQKRWQKKRREVYEGSPTHFLRSAVADRIDEEGFRVFQYDIHSNPQRPSDSLIESKIKLFKNKTKSKHTRYRDSLSFWSEKSRLPKLIRFLMNFPLAANEIIRPTNQAGIFALGCENNGLYIIYNKDSHFPKIGDIHLLEGPDTNGATLLSLKSLFVFFDRNGWIINPEAVSFTGEWSKNRAAGLLPIDYDPLIIN